MGRPKGVALIGSTGSIGQQTLEVIEAFPERFRVVALAAGRSIEAIARQAVRHRPRLVALADEAAASRAAELLGGRREACPAARPGDPAPTEVAAGMEGVIRCALLPEADTVVAAASGVAGLRPVWEAVRAGKTVALANKEPLVVAGRLILEEAARSGAQLLPVDSEHSAIFQCLLGQDRKAVRRVTLTASGGAFRDMAEADLESVTPAQALAHPTWRMGPKVTVDSATLMNKGLEVIEARWLFGLAPEQVSVVMHPESIVHGLVEFADGSVLAQLAQPDMRLPIQFALSYPERLPRAAQSVDLAGPGALRFAPVPEGRYPCLRLARQALAAGGTAPAALNAADEVAVAWFLEGRIRFTQIAQVIESALAEHEAGPGGSLEELLAADRQVRDRLQERSARWTRC
jgi:1-deoxy-D-xylulose-5-phosphate reductoisomerase